MPIFRIENNKVDRLPRVEDGFGNEAALRDFFAENLEEILGIRYLDKEHEIPNGRIDTLGIDENNSPVIIEYKWKENKEVLAQGLYYYNWLVNNKNHFNLLVHSKLNKEIEVTWDQPRLILVAQGFSRYTLSAVGQVKPHIELKTYNYYDTGILYIESVHSTTRAKSNKKETAVSTADEYGLEYHLSKTSDEMKEVFNALREKILELPSVEEKVGMKTGVAYRTTKSFASFGYRKKSIQLLIREPSYKNDKENLVADISGHLWGYKGQVKLVPDSDTDYVFDLIRQSYESTL